jgi:hypothetical protein
MASINLIDDLAVVQGKTYAKLDLRFPGDRSLWLPRAQIRRRWYYKEEGADPLAEFSFLPLVYDVLSDKTLVSPRLSADVTAAIPPSKYQEGGDLTGAYVWDLELTDPDTDQVIGLDWGWVQVKPEATVNE